MADMADPQFAFIAYEGPKLPRDPNTRSLIRRRAMKDVAAVRRQRGDYGRHNRRQFPVFVGEFIDRGRDQQASSAQKEDGTSPTKLDISNDTTPTSSTSSGCGKIYYPFPRVNNPAVTASDLSLMLSSLAPLTGLRLGLASLGGCGRSPLSAPSFSIDDLTVPRGLGSCKLLSFIPSRYGYQVSPALTHATDCVIAMIRSIMRKQAGCGGTNSRSGDLPSVLVHYSKALRALQAALDDEAQRFTPETLCATQLLGVFELLSVNDGKPYSWMRHVGGATRLMEVRGVGAFQSEFEMALLTAHVGPAVTEAFLSNKPCFLAQDPWKQVLHAAIRRDESLVDQVDLVLALWGHLVGGPEVFKLTTDLVCHSGSFSPSQQAIDDLIDRLLSDQARLKAWVGMAQIRVGLPPVETALSPEDWPDAAVFPLVGEPYLGDDMTQLALRGTYTTCRLLKARLLVALAPRRFRMLEEECQELAARIMSMSLEKDGEHDDDLGGGSLVGSLFMSQGSWVAQGIVETKKIWAMEGDDWQGNNGGIIEREKFEAWCNAMGRKFPER